MNRHQGQLVTADGDLEPAALPPAVTPDPGVVWLASHPQVVHDLAKIVATLIVHPACVKVPKRHVWETLRHQYSLAGAGVSLPNNFQRHAFARLVLVRPEWAAYFPGVVPA